MRNPQVNKLCCFTCLYLPDSHGKGDNVKAEKKPAYARVGFGGFFLQVDFFYLHKQKKVTYYIPYKFRLQLLFSRSICDLQ